MRHRKAGRRLVPTPGPETESDSGRLDTRAIPDARSSAGAKGRAEGMAWCRLLGSCSGYWSGPARSASCCSRAAM